MGTVVRVPPEMSPQLTDVSPCILDSTHTEDQTNKLQIASLSQLPYRTDDPACVQELFENRKKRRRKHATHYRVGAGVGADHARTSVATRLRTMLEAESGKLPPRRGGANEVFPSSSIVFCF